jgi:hypothetical protein
VSFEWRVLARDPSYQFQAAVEDYRSLEVTPKYDDVGVWELVMDRRAAQAANLTTPGWGIALQRNGTQLFAGPANHRRSVVSESEQTVTISGYSDDVWLFRRWASASPAESGPPYVAQAFDVRTGIASTILRQYVDVNLGPSAVAPRRKAGLAIGVDPVTGSTVTGRARWQNLLQLLQELATAGGIGFRLVQVGAGLQFQTYLPVDRSGTVKFAVDLGNLASFSYEATAPTANYVAVGGGGTGTARVMYEQPDSAAMADWERIEGDFVNRGDTSTTAELAQAATDALATASEQTQLSITPLDTPTLSYGTHYQLGDKVTVQVEGGLGDVDGTVSDIVRQVVIKLTPDGPQTVTPDVGTPGKDPVLRLFRDFARLRTRISRLERS